MLKIIRTYKITIIVKWEFLVAVIFFYTCPHTLFPFGLYPILTERREELV